MAYVSYKRLCENECDNNVSKKDRAQKLNTKQLKLEVHVSYKEDESKQQYLKLLTLKML